MSFQNLSIKAEMKGFFRQNLGFLTPKANSLAQRKSFFYFIVKKRQNFFTTLFHYMGIVNMFSVLLKDKMKHIVCQHILMNIFVVSKTSFLFLRKT
jgi:hypothetical protein